MPAYSYEAIKQARDIRQGNHGQELILQAAVSDYFENGMEAQSLTIEEKTGFLESTKPERFAALADLIDLQMGLAQDRRTGDHPIGLVRGRYKPLDPWADLIDRFRSTFKLYTDELRPTPEFTYCEQINQLMYGLGLNRITVETQLDSGIRTAVHNNLPLIRALPRMIDHFAPGTPRSSWDGIARRSSSLAYMMSRRSVEGLLVAREIINHDTDNDRYDIEKFFPVMAGSELVAIQFDSLDNQTVEEGTEIKKGFLEKILIPAGTKLEDVQSSFGPTIGCPITLLNGRLKEFWEWNVDCVMETNAWDSTY